jgi:ubiquitin
MNMDGYIFVQTGDENISNTAGGGMESKKKLKRRKDKGNPKTTQTEAGTRKLRFSSLMILS